MAVSSQQPHGSGLVSAQCAVERSAELLCGKWTLLVIRDLADGPLSYSELAQSLGGISPRTLCDRLKLLTAEGLITRTRIKGVPPRTLYELTPRGLEVVPIVVALRTVGEALLRHEPDPQALADIADAGCDE